MGDRCSVVITNVTGRDPVGFAEEARARVAQAVPLPPGYRLTWGGQLENQQRAAARLALVVPLLRGVIFVVPFSTFGSVRQALLVLSNVPFALVGGIVALWLTGEYLSVPASVGFIELLSIAVLNGVVLVSDFNQLHPEGLSLIECVRQGAMRRLRPVLMTATITAFGLVRLLFAEGPGSEIQRPLAIVVIGGPSNVEQVMGRSGSLQIQVLDTEDEMHALLAQLRSSFRGTGLRYRASPLALEGEIE